MKKIIGLILAIILTISIPVGVTFASDDISSESVAALSALGIVQGNESGDLMLDKQVTRAEFATIVTRMLGVGNATGNAEFADVPETYWGYGAISVCYNLGIINGYGNGYFGPEDPVTYEQAIKMLVSAIGYEPIAVQKGGYPTGYMVVANTYGITDDIKVSDTTKPALRGTIIELAYNTMDTPIMEQTGFGDSIEYTILDGSYNKEYKTLLTEKDVIKVEGMVVGTPIIAFNSILCDADEIIFYSEEKDDFEVYKVADGVDAAQYFGVNSTLYVYEKSKSKTEVIAIAPSKENSIVTITGKDVAELSTSVIETEDEIKYKMDKEVLYYSNYSNIDFEDVDFEDATEITLIDNNGNNKYDIVVLKTYTYGTVKSIDAESNDIEIGEDSFRFDFDDEDVIMVFADARGNEISFNDFADDDVVAYIVLDDYYEFINLGNNVVNGTVDEISSSNGVVYIDGKKYSYLDGVTLSIGDEGTFYLTAMNQIFAYDKYASSSSNYALVLDCGTNASSFKSIYQIKLLTKNNEIVVYDIAEKAKVSIDVLDELVSNDIDGVIATAEDRLITYKLNSRKEIKEISFVSTRSISNAEYDKDGESIGRTTLDNGIIIFNVDVLSIENAYATGINYLINENKYSGFYATNDDGDADCLIVTEGANALDFTQDIAIVSEVTEISIDEGAEEALKVRYHVSGNDVEKEIVLTDETEYLAPTGYIPAKGDLFMVSEDAAVYALVAEYTGEDFETNDDFIAELEADENADTTIMVGTLADWASVSSGVRITDIDGETFVVKSATNKYTLEWRRDLVIHTNSWKQGEVNKGDNDDIYLIRKVKNTVTDIFVIAN